MTDGIKSLNLPGIWGKIRLRGDRPKQSARRASAELRGELLVGRVPVTILIVVGALAPLWMIEMSPPLGAALPDRAHLASAPAHEFRIPPRPFSVPIDFPRDPKSNRPGALPLEPVDGINIAPPPPEFIERTFTIKKGDTLMPLLIGAGLPRSQAHAAITALTKHFKPKNIRPGHKMTLKFKDGGDVGVKPVFAALVFQPNIYNTITVALNEQGGFEAGKQKTIVQRRLFRAEGKITSSLYLSAVKAGVSPSILMELIRLYSWDVDFQRSIRPGDGFEVMFEKLYTEDGEFARFGNVLYGKLVLSGTNLPLYRFTTKAGLTDFFGINGKSARKALMRTPIDGARLSSGFGRRRHPILGYTKMHRGLDFAAPRGTPIYAAGNGTVVYRARNGAYGNYIRIRHNSEYSTAYGHMSRFSRKVRRGRRVKQGQIIGYVGTTGRSTGPHLHYEVLNRGRQLNPFRLKLPSGKSLKGAELVRFNAERQRVQEKYTSLPKSATVASIKK
ncbi:MAG: M23 family metallopeptidase [Rhodospirillaceae bacterium]|nr:M23 family metallopeptidase [Rhodospirillaceae bacterium]MBT3885872.1 M23 family metallopeptidase [Rhodospirillaceae bacterium]MBT4116496.1 M23 family metallopeptidase [Rhodospirillaceae bacterium]MBT4670524.1 M23 family metallopeptidase [Rhodospirillaceae bacterium]MBT4748877.1 M23 family metallopeptidase [Rhodospirillaceae bacterium]